MDDYIKRKDIFNVISIGRLEYPECDSVFDGMETEVKRIPSADVAEVVRCKDCRFHTTNPECFDEFEITDKPMMCVGIRYGGVDPDWFCEHGARMDGGT